MIGLGLGALLVIGAAYLKSSYWGTDHDSVRHLSVLLLLVGGILILISLIGILGLWQ